MIMSDHTVSLATRDLRPAVSCQWVSTSLNSVVSALLSCLDIFLSQYSCINHDYGLWNEYQCCKNVSVSILYYQEIL